MQPAGGGSVTHQRTEYWSEMMKRAALFLGLVFLVSLPALAGTTRREHHSYDAKGIERITLQHPVGRLEIVGGPGSSVELDMEVHCGMFHWNCGDEVARVSLKDRRFGSELSLDIEGEDHHSSNGVSVDLRLSVPPGVEIEIQKGVGDTIVRNVSGDVDIEAGVGDVRVEMSERDVHSVHVESGVGSARLDVGEGRVRRDGFLFLGNEVDWRGGKGQANVEVKLGVGSVHVDLGR